MKVQVLNGVTAANSPPTAGDGTVGFPLSGMGGGTETSGVATNPSRSYNVPLTGQCAFVLESTAGSATMTVTIKCWVYSNAVAEWMPYGGHVTAATRGLLNGGNAIDEVAANKLLHSELIAGLRNFDRIYFEVTAIGGTSTAVDAWLVGR